MNLRQLAAEYVHLISSPSDQARVVVVRLGQPPSPHVHQLARSIIVRPLDKRIIPQWGGCHLTVVSLAIAEWLL
jgi:hypothetical protein